MTSNVKKSRGPTVLVVGPYGISFICSQIQFYFFPIVIKKKSWILLFFIVNLFFILVKYYFINQKAYLINLNRGT